MRPNIAEGREGPQHWEYSSGYPLRDKPKQAPLTRHCSYLKWKYIAFSIGVTCRFDRSQVPNALILVALTSGYPLYGENITYYLEGLHVSGINRRWTRPEARTESPILRSPLELEMDHTTKLFQPSTHNTQ